MKCIYCGAEQHSSLEQTCPECSFYLGEGDERNYGAQLSRIAELFKVGEIDKDNFVRCLNIMSSILDAMFKTSLNSEKILPADLPEAIRKICIKPAAFMREGLEHFEEALKNYNLYAVDPDEEYLVNAANESEMAQEMIKVSRKMAAMAFMTIRKHIPAEQNLPISEFIKRATERRDAQS